MPARSFTVAKPPLTMYNVSAARDVRHITKKFEIFIDDFTTMSYFRKKEWACSANCKTNRFQKT